MCVILALLLNVLVTHKIFVGIGSNVDRKKNILTGLGGLRDCFGNLKLSSIYESVPIGVNGVKNYYNLVAGFKSDLRPVQINKHLKKIEKKAGQRSKRSCSLDIDLLLFDDLIDHSFELDIPRKDISDYAYVAVPLAEIAGNQLHPETGESFKTYSKSDKITAQKIWRSDFQLPGKM